MISPLTFQADPTWHVPDKDTCFALWNKYAMLQNIREHSIMVAKTTLYLVEELRKKGHIFCSHEARAGGLLHDIAKTYTIYHGGEHAQLGAAIVRLETGNPHLAQAILYHVYWPWDQDENLPLCLPLILSYADKRVLHHESTTLYTRFEDLMNYYGTTENSRYFIQKNYEQSKAIEELLHNMDINIHFKHSDIAAIAL